MYSLPMVHAVYIYPMNSADSKPPLILGDSESISISKALKKSKGQNLTLFAEEFASKQELRGIKEFAASDEIYELYLLPISCDDKAAFLIKKELKFDLDEKIVNSLLVLPFLDGALLRFLERSEIYRSKVLGNINRKKSIQPQSKRISSSQEIFCLEAVFRDLDIDGNGLINFEKWKNGLLAMNISITDDEMQSVFNHIINNNGNEIKWKQFYQCFGGKKSISRSNKEEEKKEESVDMIVNTVKNGIYKCLNLDSDGLILKNLKDVNVSKILSRISNCENLLDLMENVIFQCPDNETMKKWQNRYESHKLRINNYRKVLNVTLNSKIANETQSISDCNDNNKTNKKNRSHSRAKSKKLMQSNTSTVTHKDDIGLKKELKTIKKELILQQEANKTLQEKLKRAKNSSKKNVTSNSSKDNVSTNKIKKLQKEKEKLDKECAAKTKKMDEMFVKLGKKDKKYNIVSKQNATLKARLGSFQGQMNQKLQKLYDVIDEYKKRNKRMKERIKTLLATIAENDVLVAQSKKITKEVNALQSELDELEKESSKFQNENDSLNDKIQQLKDKINNKNNELDATTNKLEKFAQDLSNEYSKIDELTKQIEVKEVALSDLQIVNVEKEETNLDLENKKQELNKQLIQIQDILSFDENSKYRWFYDEIDDEKKTDDDDEKKTDDVDDEKKTDDASDQKQDDASDQKQDENEKVDIIPILVGKLSDNDSHIMFIDGKIKCDILAKTISFKAEEINNLVSYVNYMKKYIDDELISIVFPPTILTLTIDVKTAKFNISCNENINDIDIYQIEYSSNNGNNWTLKEFKSIPLELNYLTPNTKYSIRCKIKLKNNMLSHLSQIVQFTTKKDIEKLSGIQWSTSYKDKKINLSESATKATLASGCDSAVRIEYRVSKGMIVEFEFIYYNPKNQRDERFGVLSSEISAETDNKCYIRDKPNVYCLTFYTDGRQHYDKIINMGYNIGTLPIASQFKLKLKIDYKTYGNECSISFYKDGVFIGPSNQSYSMKLPSGNKAFYPVVALDWEHSWCKIISATKFA